MKKAIQILCQSTNPLGKSIDFVTDDIDSMSKEFEYWKRECMACQSKLEEQQKITEDVIQPLQD
jgi:TRAF3-interacting protein 1